MGKGKYRIVEITYYPSGEKKYLIQKRFLGFLWWYDPYEDGMYSDGYFSTYDKALDRLYKDFNYSESKRVVWTNEQAD